MLNIIAICIILLQEWHIIYFFSTFWSLNWRLYYITTWEHKKLDKTGRHKIDICVYVILFCHQIPRSCTCSKAFNRCDKKIVRHMCIRHRFFCHRIPRSCMCSKTFNRCDKKPNARPCILFIADVSVFDMHFQRKFVKKKIIKLELISTTVQVM